jgi:MFS transporter, CP family, cyanate transporter
VTLKTGRPEGKAVPGLRLVLVWLIGIDLRLTLLAIPPLIPLIHRDLRLNETGIAILTGLPVLLLAVAAVPGSLLTARLGARQAVIVGLVLTALTSGLRGVGPSAAMMYGMTFLMGIGIAITQPAVPTIIGEWFPARIGQATGIYVNGLLVGETLSAALTLPVVLPLVRGHWGACLALWAVPVMMTALLIGGLARFLPSASGTPSTPWWPEWTRATTWRLGLLLGGASAAYFGSNAFIPDFLHATGRPHLVAASLTILNAAQLPSSLVAAIAAPAIVGRRAPLQILGVAILASLGVLFVPSDWGPLLATGLLGFCLALILALALALPPLLAPRGDVHSLSAGMFAIAYLWSFATPLLGGAVWDISHSPAASFLPVAIGGLVVLAASSGLPAHPLRRSH